MTIEQLQAIFDNTELHGHCEDISTALGYYDGDNDADEFIEWYTETYIYQADVIYYSNAMEFLMKHDVSLHDSMAKAQELGYQPKDLNSELLASLLLQDILSEELASMSEEIQEYFDGLKD